MQNVLYNIMVSDTFLSGIELAASEDNPLAKMRSTPRSPLQETWRDIPDEVIVEFADMAPWSFRLSLIGEGNVRCSVEVRAVDRDPKTGPIERDRMRHLYEEIHVTMASDVFLGAIEEAEMDASVLAQFKANPRGHLERKGVRTIPDGVEIEVLELANCYCCSCTVGSLETVGIKVSFCLCVQRGYR